ncbi:MAG: hypothetical protein VB067_14795 [Christensenellaceae bacterium]|nr:hypothetical protein [Christensenellaceae bacterium]MEA5070258.1 hypothetical protein [Christensenellaceae bacterium]
MLEALEQALESVLSIIHAIWAHWTSPEFRPVLWAVLAYIIGSAQGYTACLDAQEAAQEDEDRAWLAASVASVKEELNDG